MAQKHDILYTEKPMTVGTHEQGPQKRYRRLRFPSFDADVWAEKNPLLQKGELGHEKDTGRFKVGDGVTYWSDLPYNSVGDPAKVNGHNVLEIVAGENIDLKQSGNVLTIGASGVGYSKAEIDNKFIVANAQIDANATAIQKTRSDYIQADSEIHQMINAQAAEIEKKQDELTAGDNIIISGNVISATGTGGVGFDMQVVSQLPETGKKGVIYLVPKDGTAPDVYDEYVWIDATQTFELIGTTQVDLTDYVKNTDYATGTVGGVVKVTGNHGLAVYQGMLLGSAKTLNSYDASADNLVIAKGTLENIKNNLVKCAVTTNDIELTDDEKTAARTWIGAISNTDYAGLNKVGIVGCSVPAATMTNVYGYLQAATESLVSYKAAYDFMFVGKGTLENIKDDYVKRGITANTITLTDDEKAAAQAWLGVESSGGASLPDQTGNAEKVLTTDGTNASWTEMPGLIIRRL